MRTNHAIRVVAATLGVLVGLAGIDHGIFEILQGNTRPDGLMIAAIGPAQRFWQYGEETALTIIPNYLVTGILAVVFGLLVMTWSLVFIDRKYGSGVLMLLSVILFLVGGGFAPIFMAALASLAASGIHQPLRFWRAVLPGPLRRLLAKTWLGTLVVFVIAFVASVVIAIFGWPLTAFLEAGAAFSALYSLAYATLGLMALAVLTAIARDIQIQDKGEG